jgi:tagatose-1,6-bisphosphate aldolase
MLYATQRRAIKILFAQTAKTEYSRRDEKAVTAINMLIQIRIAVICSSVMIDLGWQLRHFRQM